MANTSILSAFERMWQHIKAALSSKSDVDHTHNYAGSESEGGIANSAYAKEPITTAGTGAAYTATVPGITTLTKGVSFIMVPHTVSTSASPTLDVNGLGAKGIRRRLSNMSTTVQSGYSANWLGNGQPFTVVYNGTYWIVEGNIKTAAVDLYGTLGVAKGGTGKITLTSNAVLTGNGTSAINQVASTSGALYATEANGAPTFGTLPIAQGGTGATTAPAALTALGAAPATTFIDNVLMSRSQRVMRVWSDDISQLSTHELTAQIVYRRVTATSGYLEITVLFPSDTTNWGENYEYISLSMIGNALGITFKTPTADDFTGTWYYVNGENDAGTQWAPYAQLTATGSIILGRCYTDEGAVGGWPINSGTLSGKCICIKDIYVEEG